MKKILDFYIKYRFPLMLTVTTVLLFFTPYVSWLWIVASVLNFGFYLTCSLTQMLCATMYYEFFAGIGTFFIASILEMLAIMVVRYIVDVAKKREKLFLFPFIMTIVIIVIFSCIHYAVTVEGFYQGAILIACLMSLYLIFVYHKKINISECFRCLIIGMLVAAVLSVIAFRIPGYGFFPFTPDGRWQLFTLNVNHVSMLCLFTITYYIQQIAYKKNFMLRNLLCIIIPTIIGMLTLSKAFLIVWVLLMIYLFVCLIVRFKKKSFIVIVPLIILMAIIGAIFHDKVFVVLNRFINITIGDSFLDRILTGRLTVWREFLDVIISSVWTLLFGVGLFTQNPAEFHTHNSYLFLLHRFGFIGIILLIVLVYSYARSSEGKFKLTLKNSLMLFVFLLLSCEELLITERFMFFMFFSLLVIAHNNEDYQQRTIGLFDYIEGKFYRIICRLNKKFRNKKLSQASLPNNDISKGSTEIEPESNKIVDIEQIKDLKANSELENKSESVQNESNLNKKKAERKKNKN